MFVYHFVYPNLAVEILSEKAGKQKTGGVDFEVEDSSTFVFLYCGLKTIACSACLLLYRGKDKQRLLSMCLKDEGVLEVILLRGDDLTARRSSKGRRKECKLPIKWSSSKIVFKDFANILRAPTNYYFWKSVYYTTKKFTFLYMSEKFVLTLNSPCISESCIKTKISLNFYFCTFFVVPQKVLRYNKEMWK